MPTIEDLKYLQAQPLYRKIRITQTRIIEWHQRFNGQVYISFSGGKDSTVLLDLARRIYPDIEAVFIDTGLEYPEIREFVKTKENVTWLKPKMNFKEVIKTYGYPVISKEVSEAVYGANRGWQSMIAKFDRETFGTNKYKYLLNAPFKCSHMCCNMMKKRPAKEYEHNSNKKPIIASMTDESQLRKSTWLRNGCNAFEVKRPISTPMSFWTEQDVLQYLKLTEIPYANVYGDIVPKSKIVGQTAMTEVPIDLMTTGCDRTGCIFCTFGIMSDREPNRFQRLKITHPKQYDYCMREENGLGLGKVLDFIGVKYS